MPKIEIFVRQNQNGIAGLGGKVWRIHRISGGHGRVIARHRHHECAMKSGVTCGRVMVL
jgi:hypothetical protein